MIAEINYKEKMQPLILSDKPKHLHDIDPLNLNIDKIKDLPKSTQVFA